MSVDVFSKFDSFFYNSFFFFAGDLFECEDDMTNPSLWRDNSEAPDMQEVNRNQILQIAHVIIPGHGGSFQVNRQLVQGNTH